MSDVAVDQQKSTYFDRANLDVEGAPPLVKSRPLLRRRAPARRFPSGPRVAARVPQGMSNFYCHPGKAGGSPLDFRAGGRGAVPELRWGMLERRKAGCNFHRTTVSLRSESTLASRSDG